MSVQAGPISKRYAANGVATVYTIPFPVFSASQLQVTLNGAPVTSGFTLTGLGNPASTCTFSMAPTGDLLFQLIIPFERLTDYQESGDFLSSTVNRDFDLIWLAMKELRRDDSRALSASPLEPEGIPALPVIAVRAGKLLAFAANGNPVVSSLSLDQIEQQPALALASANAAQASATLAGERAGAASSSAAAAASSAIRAGQWAENPEDSPVVPGMFSARHWAAKAAAAVASIADLYTRMTAVEGRVTNVEFGYTSAQQSYTNGGSISLSHGLGSKPLRFGVYVVCAIAENSYVAGEEVPIGPFQSEIDSSSTQFGLSIIPDTASLSIQIASSGLIVFNKTSKSWVRATPANWRLIIRASKL